MCAFGDGGGGGGGSAFGSAMRAGGGGMPAGREMGRRLQAGEWVVPGRALAQPWRPCPAVRSAHRGRDHDVGAERQAEEEVPGGGRRARRAVHGALCLLGMRGCSGGGDWGWERWVGGGGVCMGIWGDTLLQWLFRGSGCSGADCSGGRSAARAGFAGVQQRWACCWWAGRAGR